MMLGQLRFMKRLIYIKFYKGYLEARTVGLNNERQFNSEGLSHPRSLAGKFIEVENTFKKAISAQPKVLFGFFKPNVLVHLVPEMEGGYTELELRFFREAALSGGASQIFLLDNKFGPQSDSELQDIKKWLP
mgnify:FL=1|jgi:hypothetical protein